MKRRKLVPYILVSSLVLSSLSGSVTVFAEATSKENKSEVVTDQEESSDTTEEVTAGVDETLLNTENELDNQEEEVVSEKENRAISTGQWGTSPWTLEDGVLTIESGNLGQGTGSTSAKVAGITKSEVTKVIFKGKIIVNEKSTSLFSGWSNIQTFEGLENFDTSMVTNMDSMFYKCSSLTRFNTSHFDTSKVTNMQDLFSNCGSLTELDVSGLNTSKVIQMNGMFDGCKNLTSIDVSHFNTESATTMKSMFNNCTSLTSLDLSGFDTSKVTNMSTMFGNDSNLNTLSLGGDFTFGENASLPEINSKPEYTGKWINKASEKTFSSSADLMSTYNGTNDSGTYTWEVAPVWGTCPWNLEDGVLTIESGNLGQGTGTSNAKVAGITKSEVTKIVFKENIMANENAINNFAGWSNLETVEGIENFDTSKVTRMDSMFANCSSLTSFDTSHFDTSKVTNMQRLFSSCASLTELDTSGLNTSKVTEMNEMFQGCNNLVNIDVSHFDTGSTTTMKSMFNNCTSLMNLDISGFDTSKVTNMSTMFGNDSNLSTLSLGKNFAFGEYASLPEINSNSDYTGKWIDKDSEKTFSSSADLMSTYNGTNDSGTYTWEEKKVAPVTINYVDSEGNMLADSDVLTGELGSSYESKAKEITGYELKEIPENANGTFTDEAQTVTYVYKKHVVTPFAVNYVGVQQQKVVGFVPEGVTTSQVSLMIKKDGTDEWVDTGYTAVPEAETGYFAIESRFVKDTRDFLLNNKDQIKVVFTAENGDNYEGIQVVQPYTAPVVNDFTEGDEYLTGSVPNGANQVRVSINGNLMRVVNNGPLIADDAGIDAVTGAFSIWAKTWCEGAYGSSPIQQTKTGDVITVDYGVQIYGAFNNPSTTIIVK